MFDLLRTLLVWLAIGATLGTGAGIWFAVVCVRNGVALPQTSHPQKTKIKVKVKRRWRIIPIIGFRL